MCGSHASTRVGARSRPGAGEARYPDTFRRAGIGLDDGFTDIFGGEMPELSPSLPVKEAGERWLAVAPFAAHEGKVYPLPLMESVVDEFASRPGYRIFIFGAGEKELGW